MNNLTDDAMAMIFDQSFGNNTNFTAENILEEVNTTPSEVDKAVTESFEQFRDRAAENRLNSTEDQELREFLANDELKNAVNSTMIGTLDDIIDQNTMTETEAKAWDATKKGLDEFFSASTPEEVGNSTAVDNLIEVSGDTTAAILDAILNSNTTLPAPGGNDPDLLQPGRIEVDQAELDRINSIFEEGFKNLGSFRKGSRKSNKVRKHN